MVNINGFSKILSPIDRKHFNFFSYISMIQTRNKTGSTPGSIW